MSDEPRTTPYDRVIDTFKNHRLFGRLAALAVVVIEVGTFTDALSSVSRFWKPSVESRGGLVDEYCRLLSPLLVQFDRTLDAFNRYARPDSALEVTLEDGNRKARNLLETNAHFVRPSLKESSRRLIQHYDVWLEEYIRVQRISKDSVAGFIFVGPKGYGFPRDAENAFRVRHDTVLMSLGQQFSCRV